MYQALGVEANPCLFVRTTVTSRPADDRIIFDAGLKTLPDRLKTPQPIGISGVSVIDMSAEHATAMLEEPNTTVYVGDVFDFVVGQMDATVFLFDKLYGIRDCAVEVVWNVEGRGKVQ
jgi:D-serine deaminase-like pyridoxal phosphate-dependent protein